MINSIPNHDRLLEPPDESEGPEVIEVTAWQCTACGSLYHTVEEAERCPICNWDRIG